MVSLLNFLILLLATGNTIGEHLELNCSPKQIEASITLDAFKKRISAGETKWQLISKVASDRQDEAVEVKTPTRTIKGKLLISYFWVVPNSKSVVEINNDNPEAAFRISRGERKKWTVKMASGDSFTLGILDKSVEVNEDRISPNITQKMANSRGTFLAVPIQKCIRVRRGPTVEEFFTEDLMVVLFRKNP